MFTKTPSISSALREVVSEVSASIALRTDLDWGTLPKKVYFMQGNVKEVANVLQSMANARETKDKRYPLVVLFRDIREDITANNNGLSTSFKARIGIFTLTNPTYRADEREEKNFNTILIPIFETLVYKLCKSPNFGQPSVSDLQIKKWDCYFFGTEQGRQEAKGKNPFNDYIDAIDIDSISLNLKNNC